MWEPEKLILFLQFFIPGFISLKVYQLLVPTEKIDFSKSLYEAIGFSSINYGLFFWLVIIVNKPGLNIDKPWIYYPSVIFLLFLAPVLWSILFVFLSKTKFLNRYIIGPVKSPWDIFFQQRKAYWVKVHLKDGRTIIGKYGKNSYASSYPREAQLYIEEIYKESDKGLVKVERTSGMIIFGSEIILTEFFK